QPFMCALMTDLLAPEQHETVLEVGTGLGYQTAVLAELARHVWSVEIVEELADSAQTRLEKNGYINVVIRIGDGSRGWSQHAPYDKVLVAAALRRCPVRYLNSSNRLVVSSCRWGLRARNYLQLQTKMEAEVFAGPP